MTEDARKKLLARLKALLAKTEENGCTEGEAMAALEKAAELMAAHNISHADLAASEEEIRIGTKTESDHERIRVYLCSAVGRFCDCRAWTSGPAIAFAGLESDVLFAHWLLTALARFVERNLIQFLYETGQPGAPSVRRLEAAGFVTGCCTRIAARLDQLTHERKGVGSGRGLVVAKNALIDAKLKALGIELRGRGRGGSRKMDRDAMLAGRDAGDRATFSRPVGAGGQPVAAIGRR